MQDLTDSFQIEWHGNVVVIVPARNFESIRMELIDQAADLLLGPVQEMEVPLVVFDLSHVNYFGSAFLSLLLRCHNAIKGRGGELVLCGAGTNARELLRVTALDELWAIYDTREEALASLEE